MGPLAFVLLFLTATASASLRSHDSPATGVTFTDYMSYEEVVAYLRELQLRYPRLVRVGSMGRSVQGRDLVFARVSRGSAKHRDVMLVDALTHARAWITLPAVLYFLQQLVERHQENAALLQSLDFVVVPVLNPDGYEYSRDKERLWRKNRARTYNESCIGVDLNRNYDFHWADFLTSSEPPTFLTASNDSCANTYAGPHAASEPETQSYQRFIRELNVKGRLKMFVNLSAPRQGISFPWGYSSAAPNVSDFSELSAIGKAASDAAVKAGAQPYRVQNLAANYVATGVVTDWARGVAGVDKSFLMELPSGGSDDLLGFDVPVSQILPISRQVFEAFKVFAECAKGKPSQ
ncbi:carboxypeptidase B-like [Thrips palmi]|uniref:Carboxypeptidase B-like n=1 Tax=Thrips palmi TaxID=161013 RepID=A0A6P8ZNC3_THRPL|nr:carboxypeptidase B-like [Thrips palmi]